MHTQGTFESYERERERERERYTKRETMRARERSKEQWGNKNGKLCKNRNTKRTYWQAFIENIANAIDLYIHVYIYFKFNTLLFLFNESSL